MPHKQFIHSAAAEHIALAARYLQEGGLIALPTETVYGLAADARNPEAVAKIFAAKGRPADHPLIVHLHDAGQLADWAIDIPPAAYQLAQAFWPGPLTMILPKHPAVPACVTGGQMTVGLRVPDHPVALAVLAAFAGGLAAPSANRFGHISPTTAAHVAGEFDDQLALILDGGACAVGIESTIVDLSRGQPAILRPGMISAEAIATVLGLDQQGLAQLGQAGAAAPRVSGALAAHYAPRTAMRLVARDALQNVDAHSAVLARHASPQTQRNWLQAPDDALHYAHDLYANLRALDALGCQQILVEALPASAEWDAIRDRLQRAQTGSGR